MSQESFLRQLREVALGRVERIRAQLDQRTEAGLAEALREAHTLKGEARITGRADIAELAHELEERLSNDDGHGAAQPLLASLERAVLEIATGDDQDDLEGVRRGVRHAILSVDLELVARLTRSCSELRALHREAERTAGVVGEACGKRGSPPDARALALIAARSSELAYELGRRTEALEHDLHALRMLPLSRLFAQLRLAAEQVASDLGTPLTVQVAGELLAVDRQVLDAMSEPLMHLVRNAVDHGLESSEERASAGKPPVGTLALSAEQEGQVVHLMVDDDGRGIDLDAVRRALVERSGWTEESASEAPDDVVLRQVFEPSLSTRRAVSNVSGRGLGLDIVMQRARALGGRASVTSEPGRGTSFVVTVPVSLVADPVVAAEVDGHVYALASSDVLDLRALSPETQGYAGRARVVHIDERTVPLRDLAELLGGLASPDRRAAILVRTGQGELALAVDRLLPVMHAVRQRLDPFLAGVEVVSGTVDVDGRLVPLLDVLHLGRAAERSEGPGVARAGVAPPAQRPTTKPKRVLVVDDSELTRDVLVSALRGLGYAVDEAVDGAHAMRALADGEFDLVMTDLDMPAMDGFELLRQVRASTRHARLPVVVLTTRAQDEDLRRASELGADAYLTKNDFRADEFAATVRRYVTGARS